MDDERYARPPTEPPSLEVHEWRLDAIERRLNDGAKKFAELQPKPTSRLALAGLVLGPALGAIMIVGALVWNASRYPDRDEFNKSREAAVTAQLGIDERVHAIEVKQAEQGGKIESIKATTDRLETKLDRVLSGRK